MGQKSLRRQFKSAQPHPRGSPPSVRSDWMTSKADADWHRRMAAHLFNSTWTLIEKKRRTKEERDTMIHMAHASRYHLGRRRRSERARDWGVADLPRVRGRRSTGAIPLSCAAVPRD